MMIKREDRTLVYVDVVPEKSESRTRPDESRKKNAVLHAVMVCDDMVGMKTATCLGVLSNNKNIRSCEPSVFCCVLKRLPLQRLQVAHGCV